MLDELLDTGEYMCLADPDFDAVASLSTMYSAPRMGLSALNHSLPSRLKHKTMPHMIHSSIQ